MRSDYNLEDAKKIAPKSKWSQEELKALKDDKRPRKRLYRRKSDDVLLEKEAAQEVSDKTGFAYVHVKEIIATYQKLLRREILAKRRVRITGVGSLQMTPNMPLVVTKFENKKIVGMYLSDPLWRLRFFANNTLNAEVKRSDMSKDALETIFEEEDKVPWLVEERDAYYKEKVIENPKNKK